VRKYKKYLITILIGLLMTLGILLYRNAFSQTDVSLLYSALCDAFFIAGIMLFLFGLLVMISNEHLFDLTIYGVKKVASLFFNSTGPSTSFHEYRLIKQEEEKKSFGYIVIIGIVFIAVSLIFLWLFYQVR
jgi:hypothetical protein